MAIRLPLQTVGQFTEASGEVGAGSVAGGIPHPFILPLDTDNVVVKFTASLVGAGASAIFQTSDDGGTTYYDVARTSIVSNATATGGTAQWLSISTQSAGMRSASVVATGSVTGGTGIGSAAASTLGGGQISGLPILGVQNRVFVVFTGNITNAASNSIITTVSANNVSASHN